MSPYLDHLLPFLREKLTAGGTELTQERWGEET